MKKIYIFLAVFISSLSALAQISINTDIVKIKLPRGTVLVNKPMTVPQSDGTIELVKGGEYQYENIFLSIWPSKKKQLPTKCLEDINFSRKNRGWGSENKPIGEDLHVKVPIGMNVWAWQVKYSEYVSCQFYITNKDKTSKVSGWIQFDPGVDEKAKVYLERILKGITFI
ncbi:MAG: hypothetical protein WC623_22675 [Pedobacter sp.]|uniref:hypothetical protein n=1 Tax=Pedobacter sp. TaxID=1411316 RepID=UPI00356A80CD